MSHNLYDTHYLIDESKDKKLMINIIRKGFANIPDEARKCPVCGEYVEHYMLEDKYEAPHLSCRQAIIDRDYYVQKYPTFTCDKCNTIWQYLCEKEEEKE